MLCWICTDLVQKMKVFNCDLMLTADRISNYYPSNMYLLNNYSQMNWLQGAAGHDMILQYQILNSFFKKTHIEGDTVFNNVMNIGLKKYLSKMEENHSDGIPISQKI